MKKLLPAAPLADQPKSRVKDGLGTIREEEEDDERVQEDQYTSRTLEGESCRALKKSESETTMREKKKKRRGWEAGMKKIKNIVVHPLTNLEQKYVQLMTGFAGRVSPRGTPMLMRVRSVPVWEL